MLARPRMRWAWLALALTLPLLVSGLRRVSSQQPPVSGQNTPGQTFTVTNTADGGAGSLRQAILDANAAPGADTIAFALGGAGLRRIAPASPLPAATDALVIDATTQPGYNGVPLVALDGANAGPDAAGLSFAAANCAARGLAIANFAGHGIAATGAANLSVSNNLIGGNGAAGVAASGAAATIQGNRIGVGLDANGNAVPLGNQREGILLDGAANSAVGGTAAGAGNTVVNNIGDGVRLVGTTGATIYGNFIGADGSAAAGNGGVGVLLTDSANNRVGGANGGRNVIAANLAGVVLENSGSTGNFVQNNYVGTNAAGAARLPHITDGLALRNGASGNTLGGANAGDGNLVAGNVRFAVSLTNSANANLIQGNQIGTDAAGLAALPNGDTGVSIVASSNNSVTGNRIANGNADGQNLAPNTLTIAHGVAVRAGGTRNRVLSNSIYNNTGRAVFLESANNNQAAPNIATALVNGNQIALTGSLMSAANTTFTLQFFDNQDCDEAERLIGAANVMTDANGRAEFSETFTATVTPGRRITATATDPNGNTSASSACREAAPLTVMATNANDGGPGSLRQAIADANAAPGAQTIAFNLPGPAPRVIALLSPLPPVTETLTIDGGSPGFAPGAATLNVELNGANAGDADGLVLQADGCVVRGVAINRFARSGARVESAANLIESNYFGTDSTGAQARGNGVGVTLASGAGNVVRANVVAGQTASGIVVSAPGNTVRENLVGTNADGNAALPNAGDGVQVFAANTQIFANTIGGNAGAGLRVQGASVSNVVVQANRIGTAGDGAAALPNGAGVVIAQAGGNFIGGPLAAANVIANNAGAGVAVDGGSRNAVQRNSIARNAGAGIQLTNGGNNNQPAPALDVVVNTAAGARAQGVLNAAPNSVYSLEFFANASCGNQGEQFVGAAQATTNANGAAIFNAPLSSSVAAGQFLTATATDANGNTSPFSNCRQVVDSLSVATPAGSNVLVAAGNLSIVFAQVDAAGVTTVTPMSALLAGALPGGYALTSDSFAFDLTTTANTTGAVTVSQTVTGVNDVFRFARLRLLRGENGAAVERTALAPNDPAPNFAARRVSARVSGLNSSNPFVLADFQTLNIVGRAVNAGGAGVPGVFVNVSGAAAQPVTTDAEGRYIVTNLAAGGSHTLTPAQAGNAFTPAAQTFNNLTADTAAGDFNVMPLPSSFTISGRVTDGNNAGLSNVQVFLTGLGGVATRQTDAAGNYSFAGLVNGNYTVTASRLGFNFTPPQQALNNLSSSVAGVNFTGAAIPNPTPTPTPDDSFGGPLIDRTRWNPGVSSLGPVNFDPQVFVQQGPNTTPPGLLAIVPRSGVDGQSFNGYVSAIPLDLTLTPIVGVQAMQPATGAMSATVFSLGRDENNYARFMVTGAPQNAGVSAPVTEGQTMLFQTLFNGVSSNVSLPYDPILFQYWRFRYDAVSQTIFLETSPDALVWTVRLSRSLSPATVVGLVAEIAAGTLGNTLNPGAALFDNYNVSRPVGFQFSSASYTVSESGGAANITIVRSGTTENPASVQFTTSDGTARAGEDYTPAAGALTFGIGEASKTFSIPVNGDTVLETDETVNIALSNPVGSVLDERSQATLTIIDDDSGANPIDGTGFFVRQQYRDFLGRDPDDAGLNYWSGQIDSCGANLPCLSRRRVEVSAAFFVELEFQNTGSFVARMYRASFGRQPTFAEFTPDLGRLAGTNNPAAAQALFVADWVRRPAFAARFDAMSAAAFVDALFAGTGLTPTANERSVLVLGLATQTLTRADVVLRVVNRDDFKQREYNRTFVLMQYFGYLQRDPDQGGFNFWLNVLNTQPQNARGMVCAFVTSAEYQRRFSPIVTRTNAECQGGE